MNLALIQKWEGCRLTAYLDVAGVPTIGWGTIVYRVGPLAGTRVQLGDTLTQFQADQELQVEAAGIAARLAILVTAPLRAGQREALVSLAYNIGVSAFRGSTLRLAINAGGSVEEIRAQWLRWDKAHIDGELVTVPGLANRRRAEVAQYVGRRREGRG